MSPAAGQDSPFALTFGRADLEQPLKNITVDLPPGLLGRIGSVPLCAEAKAAAGTCGAESRLGSVTTAAGPGSNPYRLPGSVYITGPYKGGPFGLSIVVPAVAGPFDLGTVVVRASISVDRATAALHVVSDDLPTILEGVPLQVRSVEMNLDRPGFMFNPTNCSRMPIAAVIGGAGGGRATVTSPFQAVNCAALPFAPVMSAKTNGTLTFKQGAALKVHLAARPGDANIKSVAVRLPKELPSRLIPTINNACLIKQFEKDYRACPGDSYIGTVTAVTPVLNKPLVGPAYIVAVPGDVPLLELKLFGQGDAAGVEVDLAGTVIIDSGGGRTKATFSTVPDVPISSFDLDLPAGPHSMLDAPSNDLCKGPITMDVNIVGQNGKRQDSTRPITVSDCPPIGGVKIVKATATRGGVQLRVLAPDAGRIAVRGNGLWEVSRRVERKLTYTVKVPLSAAGKRALARTGRLKTRPIVSFKPSNAPKTSSARSARLVIQRGGRR
jgi:hypothetical protein